MASSIGALASPKPHNSIRFEDSCFTEAEKQILWIALRELKDISASWDARAASASQSEVQKVSLSESRVQYKTSMSSDSGDASTRHGSSHGSYESSRRHGSSNGSNNGSNNGRHGSSNGSNNGSNNGSDDNSRRDTSNDSNDKSGDDSNDKSGDDSNDKSGDDSNSKSGDEGSNPGSSGQYSEDPSAPSAGEPVPSEGSVLHQRGTCRPCIYACKDKCQAGSECSFCHYPHEMPKRPGKNARRRAMRRIRRGADEGDADEEQETSEVSDTDALTNSSIPV